MHEPQVGDRVRVNGRHWLRPYEFGYVREIDPTKGGNAHLIEFDFVGRGIDGKFLYMDLLSFEAVAK